MDGVGPVKTQWVASVQVRKEKLIWDLTAFILLSYNQWFPQQEPAHHAGSVFHHSVLDSVGRI